MKNFYWLLAWTFIVLPFLAALDLVRANAQYIGHWIL